MNQPKKKIKRPDLKKRLDVVRTAPEPDISLTVTLPAAVYRAIEAAADMPVDLWITQMLVEAVDDGLLDGDGAGETE